jgi:murein tripeptide amidase MpaA
MVAISTAFDGGAVSILEVNESGKIRLALRSDSSADFRQWFYFRLDGARKKMCTITFENAHEAAYPDGWKDYRAVASYDRKHWFRVDTTYDGKTLTIRHEPTFDAIYFAYFQPYSWERHLDLLASALTSLPNCRQLRLGQTLDGRDFDMLQIGEAKAGCQKVWVIARQHPGETMAEFFVEGLLEALADPLNTLGRVLLDRCVFYVVPNMNPDGSVRGNLRTNAAGANLNREWAEPSLERSPEVYYVRRQIEKEGVDIFLDIHGDEALPHNFIAGCDGNPSFSAKQRAMQEIFKASWQRANPEFQTKFGYAAAQFGPETLTLGANAIGDRFDALAMTIEMPFKDANDAPVASVGWNGERSRRFGASVLHPIWQVLNAAI